MGRVHLDCIIYRSTNYPSADKDFFFFFFDHGKRGRNKIRGRQHEVKTEWSLSNSKAQIKKPRATTSQVSRKHGSWFLSTLFELASLVGGSGGSLDDKRSLRCVFSRVGAAAAATCDRPSNRPTNLSQQPQIYPQWVVTSSL